MIDIYSNSYFYVITRSLWGLRRWHDEQGRIFVGHGISIICEWIWDGRKRPIQMTTNSWIASWVMHLNLTLIGPFGHSLGVTTLEREQLIWRGSMGYLILVGAMFEIQDFCRGSPQSNLPLKLWLDSVFLFFLNKFKPSYWGKTYGEYLVPRDKEWHSERRNVLWNWK